MPSVQSVSPNEALHLTGPPLEFSATSGSLQPARQVNAVFRQQDGQLQPAAPQRHRITFAYVMNKMASGGGTIAGALAERVAEIVTR